MNDGLSSHEKLIWAVTVSCRLKSMSLADLYLDSFHFQKVATLDWLYIFSTLFFRDFAFQNASFHLLKKMSSKYSTAIWFQITSQSAFFLQQNRAWIMGSSFRVLALTSLNFLCCFFFFPIWDSSSFFFFVNILKRKRKHKHIIIWGSQKKSEKV